MDEKIIQAFKSVDPQKGIREYRDSNVDIKLSWNRLFEYYNRNHDKKIYPGCLPCFPKVYFFVQHEILKESQAS